MVYTNGLIGRWKCYGDALDSAGSNDMIPTNSPGFGTDRLGDSTKAYSLNGTTQYLVNTTMDTGVFNDEFSASVTFRADTLPTDRRLIGFNSTFELVASTSNNRYYLRLNGTGGSSFFSLSDTFFPNLRNNQWVTLTVSVSKNGDYVKGYVNGVLHKTTVLSSLRTDMPSAGSTTMYIGRYSSAQYWDGKLNNVMLWDRPVTDAEALEVFNIDKPNSLVHNWEMDGDLTDSVGTWTGIAQGGASLTTDVYNNVDRAYEYDGTIAQYGDFTDNAFYIQGTQFDYTVSTVVYWAGDSGVVGKNYNNIWINGTGSYDRNGCKITDAGTVCFQSYDGSYNGVNYTGYALTPGWYSIICRQLNGAKTVFVDGVPYTNSANTYQISPPGEFRLSYHQISGTNGYGSFNGKIAKTMVWDVGLSDSEVAAVVAMGNPVTTDSTYSMFGARASTVNDGLVARWKLNGNGNDSVGTNDATTVTGVISTDDRFSNIDSAYEFDTLTDKIVVPYNADFATSTVSLSCWFKPADLYTDGFVFGRYGLSGSRSFLVYKVNDDLRFYTMTSVYVVAATVLAVDEWVHVVGTYDGTNSRLYVNGELITGPLVRAYNTGSTVKLGIGCSDEYTNRSCLGVIDDAMWWNRALTDEEVLNIYKMRNPSTSSGAFPYLSTEINNNDYAGGEIDKNAIYDTYLSEAEVSGLYSGGRGVIYEDMDLRGKLVFKGKIDNAFYGVNQDNGFFVTLSGREYPQMIDRTIVGTHTSALASESIGDILSRYFTDVKLSFWTGTAWSVATYNPVTEIVTWSVPVPTFPTELINYSYEHKKAWSIIKELFGRVELEFYIDYSKEDTQWYLRSFVPETYFQSNDVIVYGDNLISMAEYGRNTTELINRVIAYGKTESDNILLLKTEEDDSSQSSLWVKDAIVRDESLANMEEIQEKADFELSEGLDIPNNGRMTVVGLSRVKPGAMITATVPYTGIEGRHKIQSFTHSISGNRFTTNVELTKRIRTIKDIFIEKVNPDDFTGGFSNINDMQDSYSVYFDEDPVAMIFSSTEQVGGRLQLEGSQVSGNAYATYKTTDRQVRYAELRRYQSYSVVTDFYDVTNDGGVSWETYSTAANAVHEFATAGGTVSFRINMSRSSSTAVTPQYESVALLYKE